MVVQCFKNNRRLRVSEVSNCYFLDWMTLLSENNKLRPRTLQYWYEVVK